MKKIISLFQRNYDGDRKVRNEVTPGAAWVINGEGVVTRKFDGTCCMIRGGQLFKRYELKKDKQAPEGFEPAQVPDAVTGDVPGWLPITEQDKWHQEALINERRFGPVPDGTYELCGPKIQGNPEGFSRHVLVRHGVELLPDCPRDFEGIKAYLQARDYEGVVFWRDPSDPNCDKVKIKKKDF